MDYFTIDLTTNQVMGNLASANMRLVNGHSGITQQPFKLVTGELYLENMKINLDSIFLPARIYKRLVLKNCVITGKMKIPFEHLDCLKILGCFQAPKKFVCYFKSIDNVVVDSKELAMKWVPRTAKLCNIVNTETDPEIRSKLQMIKWNNWLNVRELRTFVTTHPVCRAVPLHTTTSWAFAGRQDAREEFVNKIEEMAVMSGLDATMLDYTLGSGSTEIVQAMIKAIEVRARWSLQDKTMVQTLEEHRKKQKV